MPSRGSTILLGLLTVLPLACRKKQPPAVQEVEASAPVASVAPKPAPSKPPAGPPGWAYVRAKDIVAIDPSGHVSAIPGEERQFVHVLRRASDGNAYALISGDGPGSRLARLTEATLNVVADLPDCAPGTSSALDARGDHLVVMCNRDTVLEKRGASEWTKVPLPAQSFDQAIWLAKDDTLFYVSKDEAYRRDGEAWKKLEGPTFYTTSIAFLDGAGGVYMRAGGDLYRVAGDRLEAVRKDGGDLEAAQNGLFGHWSRHDGKVSIQTVEGEIETFSTKANLSRTALDDTGRAWSVVDGQVEVMSPDGREVTRVPMGSYPELDYLTLASNVAVLGAGPALPAPKPIRRTKRVTGRITVNGKPLAGAALELCPRAGWLYRGRTPCDGADEAVTHEGTTDAKGAFSFDDLAMGTYYIHYKTPDAEKWTFDSTPLPLREAQPTNLGTRAYTKGSEDPSK